MKLKDYLKKNKLTGKQFGQMVGASQQSVSNWTAGRGRPRRQHAKKIERVTGGTVTARELLGV